MTREQVHDLMENELRCVQRGNYCDRDCAKCPLVKDDKELIEAYEYVIKTLEQQPCELKIGHCKDCKYFEYDSVAKVDGIPLIVAHEICKRWGDGCKAKEDGYCFLYEPQERSNE